MNILESSLSAFFVTASVGPFVLFVSKKFNLYDYNNKRKIHVGKISRLGGIAIITGYSVSLLYIYPIATFSFNINLYLAAMMVIFTAGVIDDIIQLKPGYKLLFQFVSALMVTSSGLVLREINLFNHFHIYFGTFSYAITILIIIGFINAINLIDGLDGLAPGLVFIAAVVLFLISMLRGYTATMSLSIILACAILGYLFFIFKFGRCFIGDGGAYFLGFSIITIPLMEPSTHVYSTCMIVFPMIILFVPLVDIIYVIFKRLRSGHSIFQADRNHIHHRLINIGLSEKRAVQAIWVSAFIPGMIALATEFFPDTVFVIFLVSILFITALISYSLGLMKEKVKQYRMQ